MAGVVYDTGALIAADRGNAYVMAAHHQILKSGHKPIVPLVVLAQAWRGGTHPLLPIMLKGCQLLPEDLITAKAAGTACGAAGTADVVDAVVVITAVRQQAYVVTSDPDDLKAIADGLGVNLPVRVV